jgi:predicted NBD/HSP70 family sugar kinase
MIDDHETPGSVRDVNRLRVLRALHREPGATRTTLTAATGLSRPTVSTLVDELERVGVVEELEDDGSRPRGSGRPPAALSIAPRAGVAIGVDVGHAHVRAAVCDLAGRILADDHSVAAVDHAPEESLDLAQELVRSCLRAAEVPRSRILGVGMALAAPVDRANGTVHAQGILPSWGGVQPARELEARLELPVQLGNDANLGALGERTLGAARGVDDVVYVRLSAGIGIGLVLGGRPYEGSAGLAGELGHVRVDDAGLICRCGKRGCLETVASPVAVADLLTRSRDEPVDVAALPALVADGDRGARRAVADAGSAVGDAIAAVVNVLNPQLVVLGGDLAASGDLLVGTVRTAIDRHAIAPAAAGVQVVLGELGARAEVLGAASLVLARTPELLVQRAFRSRAADKALPEVPR